MKLVFQGLEVGKIKVIFLDVDGVLNYQNCNAHCGGFIGISDKKVKLLRKIVEASGAKIILSSSWRIGWSRTDGEYHDDLGDYLNRKLNRERLYILDRTENLGGGNRGREIMSYIEEHPMINKWVVLDDDIFEDFEKEGIMEHLVKTNFYEDNGGLKECHVEMAIKMLN